MKGHNFIQSIAEFWGKGLLHSLCNDRIGFDPVFKTDERLAHISSTGVGSHDENNVSEISFFAGIIRQGSVIHDLEENIENILVGFFNLIQEND